MRRPVTLTGVPVLVAGAGVSGQAAVRALVAAGAPVTVTVPRAEADRTRPLAAAGARVVFDLAEPPAGTALVVTSPDLRPDNPLLVAAEDAGAEVIGQAELAWRLQPEDDPFWLGVTGTNGKTTTARMLESILLAAGDRAVAIGNAELPVIETALRQQPYDALVVELSSFELHRSPTLQLSAGVVLNLTEDHLDWHGSAGSYADAVARIWGIGPAIGNADDPAVAELMRDRDIRYGFTLSAPRRGQLGVVDGKLVDHAFDPRVFAFNRRVVLAPVDAVRPSGPHNVANALAAAALARQFGVPAEAVAEGLHRFRPDRHCNEIVAEVAGVRYVDDSKAANPHAASASLAACPRVVWVAGGRLKAADVAGLAVEHADRLAGVVLLGRDQAVIAATIARHAPDLPVIDIASTDHGAMLEVVRAAAGLARPGDTVLLAPAGAPPDMFAGYRALGDAFAAAVRNLPDAGDLDLPDPP